MPLTLGTVFPNFSVKTTEGNMNIWDYQGDSWLLFFSYVADFSPACTSELAKVVELVPDFVERGVKLLGLSSCKLEDHHQWINDIMAFSKRTKDIFPFPLISDADHQITTKFGIVDPRFKDDLFYPRPCRSTAIIDRNHKVRFSGLYPASIGRNFHEIVRIIDGIQVTDVKNVVIPVNWKKGDEVSPTSLLSADPKELSSGMNSLKVPSGRNYPSFGRITL